MSWIHENTILEGDHVALIPLETKHFEELDLLARESKILEFIHLSF